MLTSNAGFEYVESRFRPLERLRNIEFARDWGLPLQATPANESIISAGLALVDNKMNSLKYQFTNYNRGGDFTGIRNSIQQVQDIRGWRFNNIFTISNVSATEAKGIFLRPTVDVTRVFKKLGSLLAQSELFCRTLLLLKTGIQIHSQRSVFPSLISRPPSSLMKANKIIGALSTPPAPTSIPVGKELQKADRSQNFNLFAELLKNEKHQFRFNGTYRILEILDQRITTQQADKSLLGRAEYLFNEWRGMVTGSVLYEVGSGQEQKRDFAFLEVPAGQGEYTWIDYNEDGIQQLNEFEIAKFQDQAKYIRIFTPTNEFIKANYNTFNYTVGLNPRSVIDMVNAKGFSKLLSKLNLQSSLQLNKKEIARGVVELNPFRAPLSDTSLITLNSVLVNTFSFNRYSSSWGFDLNNSRNRNKSTAHLRL